MDNSAYRVFAWAIANRARISFVYGGILREVCPVILGHTDRGETTLVWQVDGQTSKGPLRNPEWKCFLLSKVSDLELRSGPWQSGSNHRQMQSCVKNVDYDVNQQSPYNPKRSLGDLSSQPPPFSGGLA